MKRAWIGLLLVYSASGVTPYLQRFMNPAEFEAAGIAKLSPVELEELNRWVDRFAASKLCMGKPVQVPAAPLPCPVSTNMVNAIESEIDGTFNGWTGETIFKLTNGQIWQQSSYAYTYHYAYRPKVVIYRTSTETKMTVEGVSDPVLVKRIN